MSSCRESPPRSFNAEVAVAPSNGACSIAQLVEDALGAGDRRGSQLDGSGGLRGFDQRVPRAALPGALRGRSQGEAASSCASSRRSVPAFLRMALICAHRARHRMPTLMAGGCRREFRKSASVIEMTLVGCRSSVPPGLDERQRGGGRRLASESFAALEQARVQKTSPGYASRRAAGAANFAVGGLLRQVVVDHQRGGRCEVLAHGAAAVGARYCSGAGSEAEAETMV